MTRAARALDEVRRIVREVLGEGRVTIYLFGSWARGDPSPTSDLDVAVEAQVPLAPGSLARLREQLEESHVPFRVEVVDLGEVDPEFRRQILSEAVRWSD